MCSEIWRGWGCHLLNPIPYTLDNCEKKMLCKSFIHNWSFFALYCRKNRKSPRKVLLHNINPTIPQRQWTGVDEFRWGKVEDLPFNARRQAAIRIGDWKLITGKQGKWEIISRIQGGEDLGDFPGLFRSSSTKEFMTASSFLRCMIVTACRTFGPHILHSPYLLIQETIEIKLSHRFKLGISTFKRGRKSRTNRAVTEST